MNWHCQSILAAAAFFGKIRTKTTRMVMRSVFVFAVLLGTLHASQPPSPVLPIELISRNASGVQSATALDTTPVGISANGSKIAFSVYDPVFLGEVPAPPIFGAPFRRYGQVAVWQRGVPLRPLIRFADGLGPNDGFPVKSSEISFDKFENRTCFVSFAGNLVTSSRLGRETVFCEKPDGTYEHAAYNPETGLPEVFSRLLGGNANFDIYQTPANGLLHLAIRDRRTGVIEYVDVNDQGELGQITVNVEPGIFSWPRLSDDGRFAVFASVLNTLVPDDNTLNADGSDVFIRDRVLRKTHRITRPDGSEFLGRISGADIAGNGSILLFIASGDVVEPCLTGSPDPRGGQSLYSYEIATRTLECISVNDNNQPMGVSNLTGSDVSADGRFVLFNSDSPLHPEDNNGRADQFIRDRLKKRTYWVSQAYNGAAGNGRSATGMLSDDGNWLVFSSLASNLVPGDQNGARVDVFLRDLRPLKAEPLAVPADGLGGITLLAGLALVVGLARLRHS